MADPHAPPGDRALRTSVAAGRKNMLLLTHLRWLAAAGQLGTILAAYFWLGVPLLIEPMLAVVAGLVALNIVTLFFLSRGKTVVNWELFVALLFDFAALTLQLYMSGGPTNPFAPIGLLQVVLGAVLLEVGSAWALAALHSMAFGTLALAHRPLVLPIGYGSHISPIFIFSGWINFTLVAVLIVLFVTRIGRNLRARNDALSEMRQRAAEEDHVVRLGLLASGAAHELGTPLSSLAVILGDWSKQPALTADPAVREEIGEMRAAVTRCKEILTGILYASGEARSEAVEPMSLRAFLGAIVAQQNGQRPGLYAFEDHLGADALIVADRTLAQIIGNVLDNAAEAGATRVRVAAEMWEGQIVLVVRDDGTGFSPDVLGALGRPYNSSKDRRGAGLGLFLAYNVMRKLGGAIDIDNDPHGGAIVVIRLPLAALALDQADG